MVRKMHIYTIRTLKQTFRNWEAYIQIFILPVILLAAFAWLYGEESGYDVGLEHGNIFKLGVINRDDITSLADVLPQFNTSIQNKNLIGNPIEEGFGKVFIKNLNESSKLTPENDSRLMRLINIENEEQGGISVQNRFISLCFIIPQNFSQTIIAGLNHKINLTEGNLVSNASEIAFSEAYIKLIGDISYSRFTEAVTLLEFQLRRFYDIYSGLEYHSKIDIEYSEIKTQDFTEFHTFLPAFFIMTILMSSSGITYILAFEREIGTIDRLKLSNFSTNDLFLGLSLTQVITSLMQIVVFFLTVFFLGFPGTLNLEAILFISFASIFPVLAIGLLSSVLLEGDVAYFFPGLMAIPLSFLTGSFIPLPRIFITPDIQLWHFNPFYCASEALRKVLFFEYDLWQISWELFLLLSISLPFFILNKLSPIWDCHY
ncbi:MAG: ABC transporter permease [Candidatus Hodarchaeales archaeon]